MSRRADLAALVEAAEGRAREKQGSTPQRIVITQLAGIGGSSDEFLESYHIASTVDGHKGEHATQSRIEIVKLVALVLDVNVEVSSAQ